MINLIPNEQKRRQTLEYYLALGTLFSVLCALMFGIGAVLLVPTFVAVSADAREAARYAETLTQLAAVRAEGGPEAQVVAFQETAEILTDSAREPQIAGGLAEILAPVSAGISVDAVRISEEADGLQVSLVGVAATRSALTAFVSALRAVPGVARADLPVSALVAETNNSFSISILFIPKEHP